MKQNTLERIFRNGSDGKRRFSAVNKTGERFSTLCSGLIQDEQDFQPTHLHVWFGLPKNWEIPLRLPTLIIPALEIMKKLLAENIIPPRLIIYQATSVISKINEIPIQDALWVSNIMESNIFNFIKDNFSELIPYIDIYFWETKNDNENFEIIKNYSWHVSKVLWENGNDSHFQECEKKHSYWNDSYVFYVTANAFYNWGFNEIPFENTDGVQNIIPIWGRSETKFFETLLQTQTSFRDIFPLITQIGAFPTYYVNPRWDVRNPEELSQYKMWKKKLHPDIEKDIQILSPYSL